MNKELIDQLRKLSCVKGKQKTWISELSDARLLEVFHRLRNGETAKSIARHAQQAWAVNPTSSPHAISQGIIKFHKRIAHLLAISTSFREMKSSPFTGEVASEDTLESLDYIANLHRARIKAMLEEEKKTGVKHSFLSRDLQALATLQKVILKQRAYELTHDDPLQERRWVRRQKGIQEEFGALMKNTTQDDRERMANALGRFLELAKQNCVKLEIGDDGSYHIPEKSEA